MITHERLVYVVGGLVWFSIAGGMSEFAGAQFEPTAQTTTIIRGTR